MQGEAGGGAWMGVQATGREAAGSRLNAQDCPPFIVLIHTSIFYLL